MARTPALQDFFFAREFTRFHAHALAKAPFAHADLLLGGMGALKDELLWFQVGMAVMVISLDCLFEQLLPEWGSLNWAETMPLLGTPSSNCTLVAASPHHVHWPGYTVAPAQWGQPLSELRPQIPHPLPH